MEPLATAVLCDDVRIEHNGKLLIIGLYPQVMTFPALPATLPQMFVIATIFSDLKDPILKYTLSVTAPGLDFTHEHDSGPLQQSLFADVTRAEASVFIAIRPFSIAEPGVLDIKIRHKGGELRARRLLLQVASQPAIQKPQS